MTLRTLTALGLRSAGDAFLFQQSDSFCFDYRRVRSRPWSCCCDGSPRTLTVLVDTGKRYARVVDRFRLVPSLDVLLLTHCDDDHIGGAVDVLREVEVGELWLPASWGLYFALFRSADPDTRQQFLDRLRTPDQAADQDLSDLADRDPDDPEDSWGSAQSISLDEFNRQTHDAVVRRHDDLEEEWSGDSPDPLAAQLRAEGANDAIATPPTPATDADVAGDERMADRLARVARQLREIILTAGQRHAEIRWFSVERASASTWMNEGHPGLLTIANAVEVRIVPSRLPTPTVDLLLQALALTVQNRRALVAFAWRGVLFTSDSDLVDVPDEWIPWEECVVVCGMHHGARSSGPVAKRALLCPPHTGERLWVRSDNSDLGSRPRPASWWFNLTPPLNRRFCTQCRGKARLPRDVRLQSYADDFWDLAASPQCECT